MRKLFRFNGGIVMFYCILTAVTLLTVETGYGLRMGQMPMESQTKIVEPIDRAISLKLPILQPEFHWTFVNKKDFLAGKLVLYITRGDETTTITIFENGKISEGWEPLPLPEISKAGEIYFGFQSTRKYPTAPGDRLKVEFIAKKDLDGIGAIETGILPAGRYISEGTYSGLIDEFAISPALRKDASEETISKIRQMYEFKAFLENWETQWSLQITSGEGWLSPEERKQYEKNLGKMQNQENIKFSPEAKEVQSQCLKNLMQIGLALHLYAQDYNGEFPDNPKILFSKHYINKLEILLCPGYTIPPDVKNPSLGTMVSYVYIKGLNSKDNMSTSIVMYDLSSHNHGGLGRNVLFLDGQVRYYPEKDFQELLDKFLAEQKSTVELIPVELPASVAKLADEFKKNYVLSPEQVLKHINPPLRPEGGNNIMCFHWDGHTLKTWSTGYGKIDVAGILHSLAGIYSYEIEGDKEILDTQIKGDFIVRIGTPQETIVQSLEEILQKNLNIPVKFTFREVERDFVVATGYLKTNLLSKVEFYSTKRGGGGSGDFNELIKWISDYIGCYVISEVINPPAHTFSWRYNDSKDFADKNLMLENLSEQTGLTFKEDKRKVRILFVERTN